MSCSIDLMRLVVKAANRGVYLEVAFSTPTTLCITARRGNLMVRMNAETYLLMDRSGPISPQYEADRLLDEIFRKLDEETEAVIRTGGAEAFAMFR